jgi:hypothetical protein
MLANRRRLSNRTFLIAILAISVLFLQETLRVMAITEDENEISLRDAGSTRERPRLEAYDMDEDVVKEVEGSK